LSRLKDTIFNIDIKLFFKLKAYLKTEPSFLLKAITMLLYTRISRKYGCFIGYKSVVPSSTIFPHSLFGVFISSNAILGEKCTIFHHVTIGSNSYIASGSFDAPELGDQCYIGAGAKIIGDVKLGDNCIVGANAVVVKDIPSNHLVVSERSRIIERKA
jgi:serine O-acetyltransferase